MADIPTFIELPEKIEEKVSEQTGAISYKLLAKRRHQQHYADFWARSRAFYKGGLHLLENEPIMNRVFPKHVGENDQVYAMRKNLAHYTNHSGAIVNHLAGKLFTDPIRAQAKPEPDTFYKKFMKDCSPPNGEETSLNDLLGEVMLDAAQCQTGYALAEMPNNLDKERSSLADQEKHGDLHAWCTKVAPESVLDWKKDKSGEYVWVLLGYVSKERESIFHERDTIHEEYWLYTKEGWIRWDVKYREGSPPNDDQIYLPSEAGSHSFKKVPLVKLCLPDGLWIMSKLESLAREYFNKRNALSWAEFKSLLPSLYEYLDPGVMPNLSGPGGDENRATKQFRSPRHVQQRQAAPGQGDRAEWVAPPHGPFQHALESSNSVRDEMHRVVQQMALSADNKGATLKRSAESKQKDTDALDVVLGAYGTLGRKFIVQLLKLVEAGRGDTERTWTASGLSNYDSSSADSLINEEVILDTVEVPSPTFKAERKKLVARKVLGDSVAEEKLAEIDDEIETFYSLEGELEESITREEVRAHLEGAGEAEDDEDDPDHVLNKRQRARSEGRGGMVISSFKGDR